MYDLKHYEIVEISEGNWGIQYTDGPLIRGFTSKSNAIEDAVNKEAISQRASLIPQNIAQAQETVTDLRNSYSTFLSENPTATEEQKETKVAEIIAAQVFVDEYQSQIEQARATSTATSDFDSLDLARRVDNADTQRKALSAAAVVAVGTPDEDSAKDAAFQAELLYQRIVEEQEASIETVNPTAFGLSGIFSGISNSISGALSGAIGSVLNPINNALGSITGALGNLGGLGGALGGAGGSFGGSGSNAGTEVYNSSAGQSAAAAGGDPRVRLTPKPSQRGALLSGVLAPLGATDGLVFPYSPTITQTASVAYDDVATVHANQTWKAYQRTENVTIDISGTFTAQNETEAKYFLAAIHFLRAITKMHFGENDANKGLPPPQMILDGYGTYMYNGLSVIISNYSVDFAKDVDFIAVATGEGTSWVPAIGDLRVQCIVQQTPKQARSFDWNNFASGQLTAGGGWI